MSFSTQIVTAPSVEPITLTEAKARLGVTISDSDDDITALISECRAVCERECRRALAAQTWNLFLDDFPAGDTIELPLPPLTSVTHVKYYDTSAVQQTLSSSNYYVDTAPEPGRIVLKSTASWPTVEDGRPSAVEIRYVCGFTTYPPEVKAAILMLLAARWDNPAGDGIPLGVRNALTSLDTGKQW